MVTRKKAPIGENTSAGALRPLGTAPIATRGALASPRVSTQAGGTKLDRGPGGPKSVGYKWAKRGPGAPKMRRRMFPRYRTGIPIGSSSKEPTARNGVPKRPRSPRNGQPKQRLQLRKRGSEASRASRNGEPSHQGASWVPPGGHASRRAETEPVPGRGL